MDTREKEIKALFCINTPAQAHTWRYVIEDLIRKGNKVEILARDYGSTPELLTTFGFRFTSFKPIARKSLRLFEMIVHIENGLRVSRGFDPSIIVGFGIDAAILAAILRKPSIMFIDNEPTHIQNKMTSWFTSAIVTPDCFQEGLGKKQIRIYGYKELAYLHPNYFKPDPKIYDELGIDREEKFVILRFNAFDAVHDVSRRGFSLADKYELVRKLGKYCKIFISAEGNLPPDLENFKLRTLPNRIHHVLKYAQMIVSDTGTMTTEAAILGTPGIMCLSNAEKFGNFVELEKKYDLLYAFSQPEKAIDKAVKVIQQPDLKEHWAEKRQKLLDQDIDFTRFMVDFIENYPDNNQEVQIEKRQMLNNVAIRKGLK